jgi:hypothetical protein
MHACTRTLYTQVSWKVPADCVEALLAACLLEAGETAPQSLLKWLNLPILKGYTSSSNTTNNTDNSSSNDSSNDSNGSDSSRFVDTGIVSSFVTPTKAPVATTDTTASAGSSSDAMDVEVVQTEHATTLITTSNNDDQQQQQQSAAATDEVAAVVKEKKVRYYPAVHISTPSEWALRGRPGMNVTSLERQLQVLTAYS